MSDALGLSPADWTAVLLSLRIATVATLASLPFGVAVAYALARWRFPGQALVNGLVHLPLVLPPVVIGYVLLLAGLTAAIFLVEGAMLDWGALLVTGKALLSQDRAGLGYTLFVKWSLLLTWNLERLLYIKLLIVWHRLN